MKVLEPATLDDAIASLLDHEDSLPLAGGTAVGLMLRQGLIDPPALVSMRRVPGLTTIELDGGDLRLGAKSTLTQVSQADVVRRHAPSLATACGRVGNVRVRNVATIGGNVAEADYASDPPTVLVNLDAVCEIAGPEGLRYAPVVEVIIDFYTTSLRPGELIVAVLIPAHDAARTTYHKFVSRSSEDRPCVGVAALAQTVDGVTTHLSVTVGAVGSTPRRHDEITAPYLGRQLGDVERRAIAGAYAESIDPMSDERGSGWYRRKMIDVFVRRALEDVTQ